MKLNWMSTADTLCEDDFDLEEKYPIKTPGSSPIIHEDYIFFGSTNGSFKSVNKNTGDLEWEFFTGAVKHPKGILSTPTIKDTSVWFGAYDGCLYELDVYTGEKKGKYELCNWIGSSPIIIDDLLVIGLEYKRIVSGPIKGIEKEVEGGSITGFNIKTKKIEWEIPNKTYTHGSASYNKQLDIFVCGTNDSIVYAFNSEGNIINTLECGGPVKYAPLMIDNYAIFGSHDGSLNIWDYIVNELVYTSGEETHRTSKGKFNIPIYTTPVFINNKIYANNISGKLFCYDNNVVGKYELNEQIHGPLTKWKNNLFIPTKNGNVIVFDTSNPYITESNIGTSTSFAKSSTIYGTNFGRISHRWKISENSIYRRPLVKDGIMYVVDNKDTIFCSDIG